MNGNISKFGTTIVALTALAVLTTATPAMAAKPDGGPKLTSAVVAALDFEAEWEQEIPTLSGTWVVPNECQTEPHLAGPNEVAIIAVDGFLAPSGSAGTNFLQLRPAISEDGWNFEPTSVYTTQIAALSTGVAQLAINRKVTLAEGTSYVFGAQFRAAYPVVNAWSRCHGTVTVVRLAS